MKILVFVFLSIFLLQSCSIDTVQRCLKGTGFPCPSQERIDREEASAAIWDQKIQITKNITFPGSIECSLMYAYRDAVKECRSKHGYNLGNIKWNSSRTKYTYNCVPGDKNYSQDRMNEHGNSCRADLENEKTIVENKRNECRNMGFKDNTEYMSQCILKLTEIEKLEELHRKAKSDADRAAASQRLFQLGQSLTNMGNSLSNSGSSSSGSSSYTSNQICYYSCNGETFAENIKNTAICPMTIQRNGNTCFQK